MHLLVVLLTVGLLDLLEGKLTVLQFQIKIKEELEALLSNMEVSPSAADAGTDSNLMDAVRQKAEELSMDLKTITQLYNEYAVPFELWEVCDSSLPL